MNPATYKEAHVPREKSLDALAEVFDSLNEVQKYAACGQDAFLGSREKQAAIMYRLIRAGEAAKVFCDLFEGKQRKKEGGSRMSSVNADAEKVKVTEDEWRALHKLRDFLAHNTGFDDLVRVWKFTQDEVPNLRTRAYEAVRHYNFGQLLKPTTQTRIYVLEALMEELHVEASAGLKELEALEVKLRVLIAEGEACN